jgi:hypothetical protein
VHLTAESERDPTHPHRAESLRFLLRSIHASSMLPRAHQCAKQAFRDASRTQHGVKPQDLGETRIAVRPGSSQKDDRCDGPPRHASPSVDCHGIRMWADPIIGRVKTVSSTQKSSELPGDSTRLRESRPRDAGRRPKRRIGRRPSTHDNKSCETSTLSTAGAQLRAARGEYASRIAVRSIRSRRRRTRRPFRRHRRSGGWCTSRIQGCCCNRRWPDRS